MKDGNDLNGDFVNQVIDCIGSVVGWTKIKGGRLEADTMIANYLDSFHLIQLVAALEEKLGLSFEGSELVEEKNWISPATIASLVRRKKMASSGLNRG